MNIERGVVYDPTIQRLYVVLGMFQCVSPLDVQQMVEEHVLNQKLLGEMSAQPW